MRWIIILLITVPLTVNAEGLYLTIGAGANKTLTTSSTEWDDGDSTGAFIAVSYRWNRWDWCQCYISLNYAHLSQYETGPPFNDDKESSIDHIGVAGTWAVFER